MTFLVAFLLVGFVGLALTAQSSSGQDTYQRPPDDLAKLVEVPATPGVSLSPDRQFMLFMDRPGLPSIEELAEPELRLAGIRINPSTNGRSRTSYYTGLTYRSLDGATERAITGIPDDVTIGMVSWAPDGQHIAFQVNHPDRLELYVADVTTGESRRLIDNALNAVYGAPFSWLSDSQTLIVRAIPASRGDAPAPPRAPRGPVIQANIDGVAPARTYQDLLQNEYDEALFKHYMATQVMRVGLGGAKSPIGGQQLVRGVSPSPDGQYVMIQTIEEPFSYLVPAFRFGSSLDVYDTAVGNLVTTIDTLPLAENVPTGFGSVPTGKRSMAWRADAPATLYWVEALDGGDSRAEVDFRDRVFMLEAPFTGSAEALIDLPLRYGGVMWGDDGMALVAESWWRTRTRRFYRVDPSNPAAEDKVLLDWSYEDRYNDPGSPTMTRNAYGRSVLHMTPDGDGLYMTGTGASPDGNRPFLRVLDLDSGETEELFRSEAPYYERVVAMLDDEAKTVLTLREAVDERANYFQRTLGEGSLAKVTDFPHPYPELAEVQKEFITYERADGVGLTATLYLPPGYDKDRDGPLPTLVWAYPREFKSADAAGQVSGSPYTFKNISYWGALPYVTQGYAIIDNASMPIIGEGDAEPNDTFREQLVSNAQAAIDEGVRRGVVDPERVGVGGHSYGAFMTANLLAHSDLFRAGIARSGAYNRTLTPFGFQAEERTFWEAPEIYFGMSPFMHAPKVNEPLLMIHGEADNNSGTFPMQSERYYNALKGHGKTVRLVMLPHESHGYRAQESLLHMLWEMNTWLDTYVKNAPPRSAETIENETTGSSDR
ncbi:MAG: prolyl oligopeptidase family serine peptidase [Bacteroidota bacterium]